MSSPANSPSRTFTVYCAAVVRSSVSQPAAWVQAPACLPLYWPGAQSARSPQPSLLPDRISSNSLAFSLHLIFRKIHLISTALKSKSHQPHLAGRKPRTRSLTHGGGSLFSHQKKKKKRKRKKKSRERYVLCIVCTVLHLYTEYNYITDGAGGKNETKYNDAFDQSP